MSAKPVDGIHIEIETEAIGNDQRQIERLKDEKTTIERKIQTLQ